MRQVLNSKYIHRTIYSFQTLLLLFELSIFFLAWKRFVFSIQKAKKDLSLGLILSFLDFNTCTLLSKTHPSLPSWCPQLHQNYQDQFLTCGYDDSGTGRTFLHKILQRCKSLWKKFKFKVRGSLTFKKRDKRRLEWVFIFWIQQYQC